MVEQVLVGREDAVGEPVVAHELPDILDGVQLRALGRQGYEGDVGRDDEVVGHVPSGLIEEKNSMPARCDFGGNLGQMQVHRLGVAGRQDEGCSFSFRGTDGPEDVGRGGALVAWGCRSRAPPGPSPGDLVLLADAGLIGEPDLYLVKGNALVACDLVQARREGFLKSSMAPRACA